MLKIKSSPHYYKDITAILLYDTSDGWESVLCSIDLGYDLGRYRIINTGFGATPYYDEKAARTNEKTKV